MLITLNRREKIDLEIKNFDFEDDDLPKEEKYLYLLLYAPGNTGKINERIIGNTWLQKEMYLLNRIIPQIKLPFNEHHYGAFSPTLDTITKQNTISELIKQNNFGMGRLWLSVEGLEIGKKLWNKISDKEKNSIMDVKKFMNDMDLWELIAYSYSTFPETTENSDVVEQFEDTRLDAACSLFQRKKVSIEKAASIAGIYLEDMIEELKRRKISPFKATSSSFKKSLKYLENFT